jgi:hypothetical protein
MSPHEQQDRDAAQWQRNGSAMAAHGSAWERMAAPVWATI